MNSYRTALCLGASLFTLGLCLPSVALAQDDEPVIEEVIVTAQKRSENVQDVPMTVEVVTGEKLEENNLTKFQDLTLLVPGLELNILQDRQQVIQLRGVQFNPDSNAESTVAVYLNDSTINAAGAFRSIFDVGQVEVLRGAQGALRGRSSPSGAITVETRRPDMNDVEGFAQGETNEYGLRHITSAISLPLIPDVLSVRFALDYNDAPALNEITNFTNKIENGNRSKAGRISVRWQPTDRLDLNLMHQRLLDQTNLYSAVYSLPTCVTPGVPPAGSVTCTNRGLPNNAARPADVPLGSRQALAAGPQFNGLSQSVTQFSGSYDLGESSLFFTASTQKATQTYRQDNDSTNFYPGYFPGEGYDSFEPYEQDNAELRWQSTGDHRWQWMYGVFWSENASDGLARTSSGLAAPATAGATPPAFLYALPGGAANPLYFLDTRVPFDQGTESKAAFTAHSFKITERDTLAAAVRYQSTDVRQVVGISIGSLYVPVSCAVPSTPANPVIPDPISGRCAFRIVAARTINNVPPALQDINFSALTGSTSWTHEFTDDINGYVSYSRSHRPGGVTIGNTTGLPLELLAFDEEKSNAFEVGVKSTLFGGRLRANGSIFYQKYDGYINRVNNIQVRDTTLPCDPTNAAFRTNFTGTRAYPAGPGVINDYGNNIVAAGLDPRNCLGTAQGITFNGDAVSQGFEFQLDYLMTDRWRFGLNGAYAKAEYENTFAPCNDPDRNGIAGNQAPTNTPAQVATGEVAQFCDRDGTKLSPTTPPWAATFTAEYKRPLFGLQWYGRAIYQYKPSTTNDTNGLEVEKSETLNLYTGIQPERGAWRIQAYAKNVLNTEEVDLGETEISANTIPAAPFTTSVSSVPTGYGTVRYSNGREIGVSLRVEFGG